MAADCGSTWTTPAPTGKGVIPHACILAPSHRGRHYCQCGKVK